MYELRANTQVIVPIGPAVAVGDGFTPVTTLAVSSADEAELLKHGSTTVVDISGATFAAITSMDGYFGLTLTTSHTDTEGMLTVGINDDSLILPIKATFMVLSEAAYDSKYVAKDDGFMDVNIKTVGRADTQETEASNLEAACAAYSATRGLSGTALPAAAADGVGGLPISDAGGLDLDAKIGALTFTVANKVDANMTHLAGGSQSATDLKDFADDGYDPSTNKVQGVVLTDTVTTYTGNTPQTGDSFARIGATGSGLTTLATAAALTTHDGKLDTLTTTVGVAGAGLTEAGGDGDHLTNINLPNQTMDIVGNITGNVVGTVTTVTNLTNAPTNGDLTATMKASVNTEVLDVLNTDTFAEPGQGSPAATASLVAKLGYLYKAWRNRSTQTSSEYALYADDATTKDQEAVVSDNGTTYERGEVSTGA